VCRRHGCHKEYSDESNLEDSCRFHPGWPIFHDRMKKWTCCAKESWDWDEFMKLEGCTSGVHSDEAPKRPTPVPAVGSVPIPLSSAPIPIRSPEIIVKQAEPEKKATPTSELKPVITENGKYTCANIGCHSEFDPQSNTAESCRYHPGKPIFRDIKKSWSCCQASSYDWDDFMKIEPCAVGMHAPRMK